MTMTYPEALRKLAGFVEDNSEIFGQSNTDWRKARANVSGDKLNVHLPAGMEPEDEKALLHKIIRAFGGTWDKDAEGSTMYVRQSGVLDYFEATIFVDRDAVCERKLVRMEDVEVPAQEAVEAHTKRVPVYEWECGSLLAPTFNISDETLREVAEVSAINAEREAANA